MFTYTFLKNADASRSISPPPSAPPRPAQTYVPMEKAPLTERQNEAYEFIRSYLNNHQRPPTLVEIGDALSIASTNGVYKLLQALEKKGWIERKKHQARSIQVTDADPSSAETEGERQSLPIVSRTRSNHPDQLWERPQGSIVVDDRLLRKARDPDACLVGHAGDDGMNGAGIYKGDLLLIEEVDWPDLDDGVLAAILVRDQLVVREFHFASRKIHLRPSDRHFTEETFPPDDSMHYVIGRVLALIRTL